MERQVISRNVFESMLPQLLSILMKYGYASTPVFHMDPFGGVIKERISRWVKVGVRDPSPTGEEIRHMTLEWALVFAKHGVENAYVPRNLDYIYEAVQDALEIMGYGVNRDAYAGPTQHYACCNLWEQVAREHDK